MGDKMKEESGVLRERKKLWQDNLKIYLILYFSVPWASHFNFSISTLDKLIQFS